MKHRLSKSAKLRSLGDKRFIARAFIDLPTHCQSVCCDRKWNRLKSAWIGQHPWAKYYCEMNCRKMKHSNASQNSEVEKDSFLCDQEIFLVIKSNKFCKVELFFSHFFFLLFLSLLFHILLHLLFHLLFHLRFHLLFHLVLCCCVLDEGGEGVCGVVCVWCGTLKNPPPCVHSKHPPCVPATRPHVQNMWAFLGVHQRKHT